MAQLTITPSSSNLGTITNDIQYTVTSDTAGTLTASIMVNDAIFAQQSLTSGTSSSILITQLPTGENTITLTATLTESGGGTTTQTATWQYTKTPIAFPTAGSVADLSVNGQNVLPITLAEAVRTSPVWGGSLDLALQELSSAALYKTSAPTQEIGTLAEGTIIYLNENGSPVPFYVAKQNYEPGHNTNRTLVVRKDAVTQGAWNSSNVNTYDGSTIDTWFNSTYLNTLDSGVRTAIGTTNIPATSPYNSGVVRLEKGVFALSGTELGLTSAGLNAEGTTVPISSMLKIAYNNGTAIVYWTRSPQTSSTSNAFEVVQHGEINAFSSNYTSAYYRPAFTLPSTFTAYLDEPTPGLYDIQNNLLLPLSGSGTGFAQIETGSYIGTEKFGKGSPNKITFGFEPNILIVTGVGGSATKYQDIGFFIRNAERSFGTGAGQLSIRYNGGLDSSANVVTWNGKTVSWYSPSASNQASIQLNNRGTYNYVAFG